MAPHLRDFQRYRRYQLAAQFQSTNLSSQNPYCTSSKKKPYSTCSTTSFKSTNSIPTKTRQETGIVRPHVLTPDFQFALPPVLLLTLHFGRPDRYIKTASSSRTYRDETDVRKVHAACCSLYHRPKKTTLIEIGRKQVTWRLIFNTKLPRIQSCCASTACPLKTPSDQGISTQIQMSLK